MENGLLCQAHQRQQTGNRIFFPFDLLLRKKIINSREHSKVKMPFRHPLRFQHPIDSKKLEGTRKYLRDSKKLEIQWGSFSRLP